MGQAVQGHPAVPAVKPRHGHRRLDGDGIDLLPKFISKAPKDSVICIFHTHVANQISEEMKKQLLQMIEGIGRSRDVFHIYNNIQDRNLHLDYYLDGVESKNTIAATEGHGRWFEWFLKEPSHLS